MLTTYVQYQIYARDLPKALQTTASDPTNARNAAYYAANIGKVTTVDQFLKNYKLFSYAMTAYGLEDNLNAQGLMKKVLESNLSDPNSYANKLTDPRYRAFAAAFNFTTQGTIASTAEVQSDDQEQDTLGLYSNSSATTAADAANATTYYKDMIGNVKSVDDLIADPKLYSYVLSAYGIDTSTADQSAATIESNVKQALESDPSDPKSFVNQLGDPRYSALAAAFNFGADGTILPGRKVQSDTQQADTLTAYSDHYDDAAALNDQLDTAYFQANIGSVKSVNDLLSDPKLTDYVFQAYGLDPTTLSQSTMKLILESDPSNPQSFANTASDHRYQDVAAAFNFTATGAVAAGESAQSADQTLATTTAYAQLGAKSADSASDASTYFQANIGNVKSVNDLLADSNLYSYALTAFGIDPTTVSKATIASVLESDPSDPKSAAAQDPRYKALAAAFNFQANGNLPVGTSAQSSDQTQSTMGLYLQSSSDAQLDTAYFQANIGSVTSVDDLLNNPKLYSYVITAFGIDANSASQSSAEVKATIKQVLESDLSDPNSIANSDPRYTALAKAFNFSSDGTLPAGTSAQTTDQQQTVTDAFAQHFNDTAAQADQDATAYFQANIGNVKSVSDLIADPKLYAYVLKAYNLDPQTESPTTIENALLSNSDGVNSFADSLSDPRYAELAADFNFAANGSLTSAPLAQSANDVTSTISAYVANGPTGTAAKAAATAEAQYYQDNIGKIENVDQLLDDPRLTAFVLQAYGLSGQNISNAQLKAVLESNLADPKSAANTASDSRLRTLAAAFNFNPDGTVSRQPAQQVQSKNEVITTNQDYLEQVMEDKAGKQDQGVELALYFQRKATTIKTPYDILADKALLKVVQTALNLPASSSQINIDLQARMISNKLNVADFQNPKKLQTFISHFTALYDMQNPSSSGAANAILYAAQNPLS